MASIYLLLAGVADTHSKVFIENLRNRTSPECKVTEDLFTCLLKCSDLPGAYPVDETSSSITFGFWYTLQVCYFLKRFHLVFIILQHRMTFSPGQIQLNVRNCY